MQQSTTFKWEYNGQLIFTDWGKDEYLVKPTTINVASDKSSIYIEMKCDDGEGEGLVTVKMSLKKYNDTSWLVGTWNADDDDFGTTIMVFKADGTGTIKNGPSYSSAKSFSWTYDGKTLSFPEDDWKPTMYWVSKVVSVSKDRIVIDFEDDDGFYNGVAFTKAV